MAQGIFAAGSVVAIVLIGLLVATLVVPSLRIWPTPGAKTWQSYVFWPLFRGLNVLAVAAAVFDRTPYFGLPVWVRVAAALAAAGAVGLFAYAFRVLGRDNSYCATDGLVTGGIYQWSRNPQNAMLIAVYGCLAVMADSFSAWVLCASMMLVYFLMVLAEEPWLEGIYGQAYRDYVRAVPRFFNFARLLRR